VAGTVIPSVIGGVTDFARSRMDATTAREATEAEAKAAQDALDWQKQVYAQRQRQFAPYIGVGQGATTTMGHLMGIREPEGGYQPPPESQVPSQATAPAGGASAPVPTPTAPAGQPVPSPGAPGTVTMKAPDGRVLQVPMSDVGRLEGLGAVRI
jgi:hypothetical protein